MLMDTLNHQIMQNNEYHKNIQSTLAQPGLTLCHVATVAGCIEFGTTLGEVRHLLQYFILFFERNEFN